MPQSPTGGGALPIPKIADLDVRARETKDASPLPLEMAKETPSICREWTSQHGNTITHVGKASRRQ